MRNLIAQPELCRLAREQKTVIGGIAQRLAQAVDRLAQVAIGDRLAGIGPQQRCQRSTRVRLIGLNGEIGEQCLGLGRTKVVDRLAVLQKRKVMKQREGKGHDGCWSPHRSVT